MIASTIVRTGSDFSILEIIDNAASTAPCTAATAELRTKTAVRNGCELQYDCSDAKFWGLSPHWGRCKW